MNEKPWWQSKSFWINTLTLLVGGLTVTLNHEWVQNNPDVIAMFSLALALLNVILRWLTDQPITSITKAGDRLRKKISPHFGENGK